MAGLFTKLFFSTALASSLAFSIPSTSVYERPEPTGTAIMAEVTSYNSEVGQTDDTPFITASGTHVHDGTIACPTRYPFGTIVRIERKEYVCEDRMNKKFPERFDIWMADKKESEAWGVKKLGISVFVGNQKGIDTK